MSLAAYQAVWADERIWGPAGKNGGLMPNEKLVMLALADFASPSGWAWPSTQTLAKKVGVSYRHCIRVLDTLERMGFIMMVAGGGWNGTNLYGINSICKGKFHPPSPDEIAKAMRTKKAAVSRPISPDSLSASLTPCQADDQERQMSAEPELTNRESLNSVEGPSLEAVLKFASEYPGNPARNVPPVIPESWARDHYHIRTFDKRDWAPAWQEAMVSLFENQYCDGNSKARGQVKNSKRGWSVWELKQVLEQLKKCAANHPANENSAAYTSDVPEEEKADYEQILKKIEVIETKIEKTAT